MYRYLAMIWNRGLPHGEDMASRLARELCATSRDYHLVLHRQGLDILATGPQGALDTHLLNGGHGAIIGSVFDRRRDELDDDLSPVATFDAHRTARILASRGRTLVSEQWGNYVAFLTDDSCRLVWVLKDPTGSLPCYVTSFCGVSIVFSCLRDCLAIGMRSFTVNWNYVEARIARNSAAVSHEPLNNVSSLRGGECVEFQDGRPCTPQLYWAPVGFSAPANVIADPEFASRALRATVRSVTRTLVRKHADILLRLSGGLDSSIVAGCLKDLDRATIVSAYVGFAPGGKSDERRWARLSARDAGFDLIEWPIEAHSVSLERTVAGIKASVEPTSILLRTIRGEIEKQLLARRPYSAVISGHGGDSVFGAEAIRQTLDDFLRLRGLRRETLGIASSIGAFTDSLAWTVLAGSLRRWIRGSRMRDFEQPLGDWQSLAAEHVRARREARTFPHPWFDDYPDVPWPVIRRVGALILPTEFYDPTLSLDIETPLELAPLYSQPVTELSLRIPLYLHFDCGVERGLARRAFSQDVPAAILDRLWKDRAPGHIETVMLANRGLFRETLLGGAIAQAGLIDSATIAQMLDGRFSRGSYFVGQLFSLLDLEHWIRGFSTPKSAFQFDAATVECQVRSAGRG